MNQPIVLITGANRGLGLELALRLAARGARVLAGGRNRARLPVRAGIEPLAVDLTDGTSLQSAAENLARDPGRIDVLINNAAVLLAEDQDLLTLAPETLRRTLETNLLGTLRAIQAFAPLLVRGGRIINVSSGGGQLSSPSTWSPAYCLSKTALNGLTVQLAEALRPRGIAVNAVCPGWVRTDMGGPEAPRSVPEGAAGILWLALEAPPSLTGGFFRDGERIPW